jgi:hypothetical protein
MAREANRPASAITQKEKICSFNPIVGKREAMLEFQTARNPHASGKNMPLFTRACAIVVIIALVFAASPVPAAQSAKNKNNNDSDQKELYAYVLTMDKIQKLNAASKDLREWASKNPKAAELDNDNSLEKGSISESARALETKAPEAVAILRKNGLTAREYMVLMFTLLQTSILVGAKKAGQMPEYTKEATALVNPANLTFVEQHWDELQKLDLSGGKSKDSKDSDESKDAEDKP